MLARCDACSADAQSGNLTGLVIVRPCDRFSHRSSKPGEFRTLGFTAQYVGNG